MSGRFSLILRERESLIIGESWAGAIQQFPFYRQATELQRATLETAGTLLLRCALEALERAGEGEEEKAFSSRAKPWPKRAYRWRKSWASCIC